MKLLHKAKSDIFISTSFNIFLIRFFPSLALTLVMILFSRTLSFDDYGYYQQYYTQALLLGAIACAGIQAIVVTYDKEKLIALLKSLSMRSYILFSLWVFAISIVFSIIQPFHEFPAALSVVFLISYCLQLITEALLIAYKKFSSLIVISIMYALLFTVFHVLVLQKVWSFANLFLALAMLCLAKGFICLLIIRKEKNIANIDTTAILTTQKLWRQLGLYDVLQVVFRWIDKFILGFILTKSMFAIYYNGSVDIPFIPIMLGAAGSALLMQLAQGKHKTSQQTIDIMHHSSRLLSSLVFPLFLLLLVFRYELFEVVFSVKYIDAVPIFLMAILVLPLRAYNFTTVLQNKHRGDIINIGAVLDLVIACALMYPFYQFMDLPGVTLAFVVSTYIQALFYLWHTAKLLKTKTLSLIPIKNWLLKLIIFSGAIITIHYCICYVFTPIFVLILGCATALVLMGVSLSIDLSVANKNYGKANS